MASNSPLPSGEGSPGYYERQFGDRVRSVRKGGGSGGGGNSRWNGGAAAGIVVAIVLAILRIAGSSSRHTPTPHFETPAFNPHAADDFDLDRIQKQIQDLQFQPIPDVPLVMPDAPADDANLLTEEEVALWTGLCYRIEQERQQPQATPGKHICSLLDREALPLLRRAAAGAELNAAERNQLLDALNELIDVPEFYHAASFADIPGVADLRLRNRNDDGNKPNIIRRFNRALLEASYPRQIIPVRLKDNLDDDTRRAWKERARADLAAAKKQYGSRK
jgi:hypothetical protein